MNGLQKLRDAIVSRLWFYQFKDWRHQFAIRRILALTPQEKAARGITRTVRLAGNFPGLWPRTFALTPHGSCQWGKTLFVADGPGDHYFVLNSVEKRISGRSFLSKVELPSDPARIWALHMEPEGYVQKLGYDDPVEHAKFSRFYTTCQSLLAKGGIYRASPPYVHFHVGRTWDALEAARPMPKKLSVGMIMSGLQHIEGHRNRFAFLEALCASDLDFGFWGRGKNLQNYRGYRGFAVRKWDVHAACRYSIVMENSIAPNYWSEKPADALLSWSLPFYHGCPNLEDYLPAESFIRVDIRNPEATIETIRRTLRDDPYEKRLPAIAEARRRLLHEQNLYAFIDRELDAAGIGQS